MSQELSSEVEKVVAKLRVEKQSGLGKCGKCHNTMPVAHMVARLHPKGGQRVNLCPDCAEIVDARIAVEREEKASADVARAAGQRYAHSTWEAFQSFCNHPPPRPPFQIIRGAYDGGRSLWLYGNPGTGKTFAAATCFRDALVRGIPLASFWPVPDLVDFLREQSREAAATSNALSALRGHHFMVLDDLMVEKPTDFVVTEMNRIVDWRYRDNLQTIVTSNQGPREVLAVYGSRMVSRLLEMCGKDGVIKFEGDDHRLDRWRA